MGAFAGVDLHKRVSQMAVLWEQQQREPSQLRFGNDLKTVDGILGQLPPRSHIAVEAMGSWWWFVEKARSLGHEVCLSHPKQTKAIASARLKSDKVDALMLARLLKADLLPTVWIPSERQRQVRELLTHRARVVRQRTAVINELEALYAKRNIDFEMTGRRGRPIISEAGELSGYGPSIVGRNVELLNVLNEQIRAVDQELERVAKEDPQATRLMTIPGVGPLTAVAVCSSVGDITRFGDAKKLASYFGLVPRVRQSAEHERRGHITKEGNRMVRSLLVEAALSNIRYSKELTRKHYMGVLKRRGKKIARVAAARKLLAAMFHMMKDQIDYKEYVTRNSAQ
jgi:transposase